MYVEGDDFQSRDFRRGVWHQTTTAVALLTCSAGGRANVMACEWAMLVSQTPMCFVISVHPSHETHALLEAAGEFGLSFCSDAQASLSHVSGSYSLRDADKWQLADFPTYVATKIGAPMIDGAHVNVECRIVGQHSLGHTVFIGEAVWARYDPDKRPLLYHDGKYWQFGPQCPRSRRCRRTADRADARPRVHSVRRAPSPASFSDCSLRGRSARRRLNLELIAHAVDNAGPGGRPLQREATIQKVNPYELHGVRYFQMLLSFADAPDSPREVRLAHDAVYASPSEGDRVTVETLLSMITEVRKKAD